MPGELSPENILHQLDTGQLLPFYLFHGDGVAHKDVGYRVLKRILRNKINIRIFRWLHPDAGIPFARFVSGSSRHYTNNINLNANPDYIEFAEKKFSEGFDFVLMGIGIHHWNIQKEKTTK